jgi:hypothetical protein
MSTATQTVQVTLLLPRDVYERAEQAAADEKRQLGELLNGLVAEGLEARASVREQFERVSAQYRARLAQEGKLEQSPDELLDELRSLREQVVRELYP